MLEYILQIIFLFGVLFVYMLSGSVVYSAAGEGYKSTPLRCFAVGVGLWILLVVLSSAIFAINLQYLWWFYLIATFVGLFALPKKDQEETLDKQFYLQVLASFVIVLPILFLLEGDKLHFWQEFAIYGKNLFSLAANSYIEVDSLKSPLAYPLAILPVSYFTNLQDNIFACFNVAILAFVACEFVRNSGVKIVLGNIVFPLIISFALLVVFNPFSVKELTLSADPFIFICAIGFAFAEYIFRAGHLPKSLAVLPPAIILMLLAFSSTQGFLLSCSLFLVLTLRYLVQLKHLNHKQIIGYFLMPLLTAFVVILVQYLLNKQGFAFLLFDITQLSADNIVIYYKAIGILAKQHVVEFSYIVIIMALGLYRLTKIKNTEGLIVDRVLLRPVFWVVAIYLLVCIPIFFSQYDKVARASYSLGFTSIALIQFIILMPIGRAIKELLDRLELKVSGSVKLTIILALLVVFVMNRQLVDTKQTEQVKNIQEIADYVQANIAQGSTIAIVDIKKSGVFYKHILNYKNYNEINFKTYEVKKLPKTLENTHKQFVSQQVNYVLLHAPNNMIIDSFEYNLNPHFSYLYEVRNDGFYLMKKFDNSGYIDTNILIK